MGKGDSGKRRLWENRRKKGFWESEFLERSFGEKRILREKIDLGKMRFWEKGILGEGDFEKRGFLGKGSFRKVDVGKKDLENRGFGGIEIWGI